jgi:hypothetical protein
VWDVLLTAYEDPAELPLLGAIGDAWASYEASAAALALEVGPQAERADAAAIAGDCRALAEVIPGVLATQREWPRLLCSRLLGRLERVPPTVDAVLCGAGVDVWPVLERLRQSVCRPALWADSGIVGDLLSLADALSLPVELPTRTKPHATARARLIDQLRAIFTATPPDFAGRKSDADALILDVLEALKIKAPKRL